MEKKSKDSLIKNIFYSIFTGTFSKIGALIFTIIVARILTPESFGTYSLALTIILIFYFLSDFGIGTTMIKYLSEIITKKDKKQIRSRFIFLLKYKILLSILISALLFFSSGILAAFFKKPEIIPLLQVGSIYLFLYSIYTINLYLFSAFQKVKYSAISESIFQISRIALIFIFILWFRTIEMIFIVLSISLLFSIIYSGKIIHNNYSYILKGKKEPVERKRMMRFSTILTLGSFSMLVFSNIDKLVLGYFLNVEFVGYYNAIATLVGGVLGLISLNAVFLPLFVQLNKERLNIAFKKTFHYLSIIAFPISIGLAFILLPLIKLFYGGEYVPKEFEFALLLTSIFLSLTILETIFSSLYKVLFDSEEKPKIPAITNFVTAMVNIVLNIILIYYLIEINPSYGLIGVSLATFLSRYSGMFFMMIVSRKKMGIFPDLNSILKPFFASLIMLIYLIIFDYFVKLNVFNGILMISTGAIIYFAMIFLLKATSLKEIKELIKNNSDIV